MASFRFNHYDKQSIQCKLSMRACGSIETNAITIPWRRTSRSNPCKLQQWYLVRLRLAYNKNYWWEIMFLVPYDAYNWKNTRNIHWLKDASSIWMSMLTQFYSPVSMNPTMTFSWFLVDSPGTSPSAFVDKPMKSQEWVVCSLLFALGNTETTPGISEEMNIGFKFQHHSHHHWTHF